jgi:hypothetical protein
MGSWYFGKHERRRIAELGCKVLTARVIVGVRPPFERGRTQRNDVTKVKTTPGFRDES